jgi:hypothetical protein
MLQGAIGVKIVASDIGRAIAGTPLSKFILMFLCFVCVRVCPYSFLF